MIDSISITSSAKEEMIDITSHIEKIVSRSSPADGVCMVSTPHTTAAVTINENADPSVRKDILKGLKHLALESVDYAHMEGNSPAHIKSSIIGCSVIIPVEKGRLVLGRWQGIYFCEFDGPRSRKIMVKMI